MANLSRTLKHFEHLGDNVSDNVGHRLSSLRKEVASLAEEIADRNGHHFDEARERFEDVSRQVRRSGRHIAKRASHDAQVAGRVVADNPVATVVAVGTVVLLASLLIARRN